MVQLDRRQFLISIALAGGALAIGCAEKKEENGLEKELLTDFISNPLNLTLSEEGIESILADIDSEGRLIGRAVHIGGSFYLTAYHVVEQETRDLYLVPKLMEGSFGYAKDFNIVFFDEKSDLALLQIKDYKKSRNSSVHLAKEIPQVNSKVSFFTRLKGTNNTHFELAYGGKDYYNQSKDVKQLGKLILKKGSLLFERQGEVWKFDEDILIQVSATDACFSSLSCFSGDSGSPVFVRQGDLYIFTGILSEMYQIAHKIPTPNHPLGYEHMSQTGGVFIHRETIERFIRSYLKTIK